MERNIKSDAVILRTRRIGDFHKGVSCLTPEFGVIDTVAYGAYRGKSRLSGITDPLTRVFFHLYYNPVKKMYKIVDARRIRSYNGIRENLDRYYGASLLSEIILKSYGGGGDFPSLFALVSDAFSVLDECSTDKIDLAVIQFLWRFMVLSGFRPELNSCSVCGRNIERPESLFLVEDENSFACRDCSSGRGAEINGGSRKYLEHTGVLDFTKAVGIGLERRTVMSLKGMMIRMIRGILEVPLNTLKYKG